MAWKYIKNSASALDTIVISPYDEVTNKIKKETMLDFLNITKALGDENRIRILMALEERNLCVCQVTAFLDLAPSTTSKHLSVLRQARLVESHKHGKWVYYRLAKDSSSSLVENALAWVLSTLMEHPVVLRDREHIKKVLEREDLLAAEHLEYRHSLEIHILEEKEL